MPEPLALHKQSVSDPPQQPHSQSFGMRVTLAVLSCALLAAAAVTPIAVKEEKRQDVTIPACINPAQEVPVN